MANVFGAHSLEVCPPLKRLGKVMMLVKHGQADDSSNSCCPHGDD